MDNISDEFDNKSSNQFAEQQQQPVEYDINKEKALLMNMEKDISSMPDSFERNIIRLIYYISLKKNDQLDPKALVTEDEINRSFELTQNRLKLEELGSVMATQSLEKSWQYAKARNWKAALDELKQLLKKIRPLDIQELLRLIIEIDSAAELVKGQDIILFLGGTGAGKSTTIQFLAGSKMEAVEVNGLYHIAATEIKNESLKKITTSPFASSETKFIIPVSINYEDVGADTSGSITICDSPGYEDTNGPEIDITNGIGIVKAIYQCKSVKPVVLISYKSVGDRLTGLKDLVRMLIGMIPGFKDQMKTFSFFFTKYPETERKRILASLEDIKANLTTEDKADKGFTDFLVNMIKKAKNKKIKIIDPLNDQPGEILDELAETSAIQNPDEVFKFSITEKSKAVIQDQIQKHQLSINSAIKRHDYAFIKFKLDELKKLKDLLNQDNIDQVYSECIRSVKKHLTEEYENSTSTLNRCLMDENNLTQEDVDIYRTCIGRAIDSQEIIIAHLEEEVTQSTAYLQNIEAQVSNILLSLEERTLEDMTLKIALDKIKLLANSFQNVDFRYKKACEILLKKFNTAVDAIKDAISSNEFDKCTADFNKVFVCMSQFGGHISLKDMEESYSNLKKSFIETVDSFIEKHSNALQKEQLQKPDIKALDVAISKLEAIKLEYNLHSHIKIQDINEIYESLIQKILTYFEGLNKKINDLFQSQRENSFQPIKQLLEEMTLIRTLTAIEPKTSESYHSTLEMLCGFIKESRRDIDHLLALLNEENENLDCKALLSNVNALKSAEWINNFRPDVYSDVIKSVKTQITDYIKRRKKVLSEVDLDINNPQKIEIALKIKTRINTIGEVFSELSPEVEAVNSLFDTKLNETLNSIKDFTNKINQLLQTEEAVLEKPNNEDEKENTEIKKTKEMTIEKSRSQNIPWKKAEKAYNYLVACNKLKILREQYQNLLSNFEDYIKDFNKFVQAEIKDCFTEVISYNADGDRKNLFSIALKLADYLEEICEIKKNSDIIFSIFDPDQKIIDEWARKLSSYAVDLSYNMGQLYAAKVNQELNNKLLIAKALSQLDHLDEILKKEKFIDIYKNFQDLFYKEAPNTLKEVNEAIKNMDYDSVLSYMSELEKTSNEISQRHFRQLKKILNDSVENLMEDTMSMARLTLLRDNVVPDKFDPIVKNLKKIQNAKTTIPHYLDESKLDKCVEWIKQTLSRNLSNFCKSIEGSITSHNFHEVDEQKTHLNLISAMLGSYCKEEVVQEIEKLEKVQKETLDEMVKMYSEMDLSGYLMNPPKDIFEKFSKLGGSKPIYNIALNNIKEKVVEKLREELKEAKDCGLNEGNNQHLRNFESALNCLPDNIKTLLAMELKNCKADIEKLQQDHEGELKTTIASSDFKKVESLILKCRESQRNSSARKIEDHILKQVYDIRKKADQAFRQKNFKDIFISLPKLFEIKTSLGKTITEVMEPYTELQNQLLRTFAELHSAFLGQFLNSNILVVTEEVARVAEKDFSCLLDFIQFRNQYQGQAILTDMLPPDFCNKLNDLNTKLTNYFTEHNNKYEQSLKDMNISQMKICLDTLNKWGSLIQKIKNYASTHISDEINMASLAEILTKVKSYSQMLKIISDKLKGLTDEIIQCSLVNEETKKFDNSRDNFYDSLNKRLTLLTSFGEIEGHDLGIDIYAFRKECKKALEDKIAQIFVNINGLVDKFLNSNVLPKDEYGTLNMLYKNLVSFEKHVKAFEFKEIKSLDRIETKILDRVYSLALNAEENPKVDNVSECLIKMKIISDNLPLFKDKVNQRIDEVIQSFKTKNGGAGALARLGTVLNRDKTGVGPSIISDHKCFQGYSLSLFNTKTQKHGIDYVLEKLRGDNIEISLLKRRYEKFNQEFQSLIQKYLHPNMKLDQIIADTKLLAGDVKHDAEDIEWDGEIKQKVPVLMAHIFALWTLKNAEHYFEAQNLQDKESYLFQPHAAQVIAIFRMLGIGDKNEDLRNSLVQIGTGEGKSVVLAVTASVLALLGFEVSCACYSEYLSQRDYAAFQSLFDSLGLLEYIHYGTFNKMCEQLINQNGDIRKVVEKLISQNQNDAIVNNRKPKRPKILLIDEVDVFFSKDFYGNIYTPSTSLRDPTISNLIDMIWQRCRSFFGNLLNIKSSAEYQVCCNRFKGWESIIEEAVKDMLFDLKKYKSHDYVVKEDKIGYKEQDNIVYNVVYGYKTLFAYYEEFEKGRVSKQSLDQNKRIGIKCGHFSYAQIPLQFKFIMGVTGTLETLSDPEKKVIQQFYKIQKNTYTPSVFGANNLSFSKKTDVLIENSHDYYNTIVREIEARLVGKNQGTERAVLVFFESTKKLIDFYNSSALAHIKHKVDFVTEEASLLEKEAAVKRSTTSGQITLFSRVFGRGTDFVCRDQVVGANGGVHVIQTFASEELSEEVQIRGRTARQGDSGSYSMVLLDSELENFLITKEDLENVKIGKEVINRLVNFMIGGKKYNTEYDLLNEKRNYLFKSQYDDNTTFVNKAKAQHEESQRFLDSVCSGDYNFVKEFLKNENKGVGGGISRSRTIVLMDATGSMSHLLQKAKNTVSIMFERASEVLQSEGVNSDSFQIQFAVYRNYNSKEDKLLQNSPWETKPDNLRTFMDKIKVEGGLGNEAVEIGLWHANQEDEIERISQVILIGDAPANTKFEISMRRSLHFGGEKYWEKTKFKQPTDYLQELDKLRQKNIPVHTFFVCRDAEANFKEIANKTGGRCELLDINSPDGAKILTDLVTEEVLRNVGKMNNRNGDDFVKAYRAKFNKSFME